MLGGRIGPAISTGKIGPETLNGTIGPEIPAGKIGPRSEGSSSVEFWLGRIGPLVDISAFSTVKVS